MLSKLRTSNNFVIVRRVAQAALAADIAAAAAEMAASSSEKKAGLLQSVLCIVLQINQNGRPLQVLRKRSKRLSPLGC